MAESVKDRRIRKTEAQLLKGLTTLMETKSINDITVRELSDLVDINRSTFYLHYKDIYDMVQTIEDNLIDKFTTKLDVINKNRIGKLIKEQELFSTMESIFSLIYENRDVCYAFLGHNGDIKFVNKIKNIISDRIDFLLYDTELLKQNDISETDFELMKNYFISGCIGLVQTWLDMEIKSNLKINPNHMAALFVKLVKSNLPYII